ncbi:MAG: hypothetical protein AAF558_11245, partial [Verrucomicrobiota bacterium]
KKTPIFPLKAAHEPKQSGWLSRLIPKIIRKEPSQNNSYGIKVSRKHPIVSAQEQAAHPSKKRLLVNTIHSFNQPHARK